jgi:hypothetical protein
LLAQDLQTRGIIKYSRGKIIIADRAMLEPYACECYQAIKASVMPVLVATTPTRLRDGTRRGHPRKT